MSVLEQKVVLLTGIYGGELGFLGLNSEENALDVCARGRCQQNPRTQHGAFPHLPVPSSPFIRNLGHLGWNLSEDRPWALEFGKYT